MRIVLFTEFKKELITYCLFWKLKHNKHELIERYSYLKSNNKIKKSINTINFSFLNDILINTEQIKKLLEKKNIYFL